MHIAQSELAKINTVYTPEDKLQCVQATFQFVASAISASARDSKPFGAANRTFSASVGTLFSGACLTVIWGAGCMVIPHLRALFFFGACLSGGVLPRRVVDVLAEVYTTWHSCRTQAVYSQTPRATHDASRGRPHSAAVHSCSIH